MKQNEKVPLPIDKYLPEILTVTSDYSTIMVKASPGSGKTTRLPWAIAHQLKKKVVVLEPRRLAAKLAAKRISEEEGKILGKEIGYHFRFEKNCQEDTLVTFYTEGTFLKKFIHDPDLSTIDVVILDEFHERHLETDLALALLRQLQIKRKNLKIILMSATLDVKLVESFKDCKVVEIEAPIFPVKIHYLPNQPSVLNDPLEVKVKKALQLFKDKGDILVFLPGMREMEKVRSICSENIFLLHADLSKEEQDDALSPSSYQKIILATNIAESSVTIPGIKVVIDSGIQREAHYSPWNGLKFIKDVPITKSSAIQRAGRAGRTSPGECLRLYSEQDFLSRPDHTIPEIEKADLTDTHLLVSHINIQPLWFHIPPKEKWSKAQELLVRMGAIDENGITLTGKKMVDIPLDSRLSRIILASEGLTKEAQIKLLDYLCQEIEGDFSGNLKRRLKPFLGQTGLESSWEKCLLLGFLDQVAKARPKQRDFIHYSGKIIKAHPGISIEEDYYLILDITQRQEAIKLLPIDEKWLWELDPFPLTEEEEIELTDHILLKRKTKLGSIVLEEATLRKKYSELSLKMKSSLEQKSLSVFKELTETWKESERFLRLDYYAQIKGVDVKNLFAGVTSEQYFKHEDTFNEERFEQFLLNIIHENLDLSHFDREAPLSLNLGGKRELKIHYQLGMDPYLEAPIQDFYGLSETPTIMNGSVTLTIKLLGPHKRPMQITKDIKNFWNKTYQEMKKEYQRDYPRHYWPDRPWEAKPVLLKRMLLQ